MASFKDMQSLLNESSEYDDEQVLAPGYGVMLFSQVKKLAIQQLESALTFAKQSMWAQASKQLDLYELFAKTARVSQERFEAGTHKKARKK